MTGSCTNAVEMQGERRLPTDLFSVSGIVVAAATHVWSLYAVAARATGGNWPMDSWVRLLPAADDGGALWLELLPLAFLWLTSGGFYLAMRREAGAAAGWTTFVGVMARTAVLCVGVLLGSYLWAIT